MVCTIFAVAAVEAFVHELGDEALRLIPRDRDTQRDLRLDLGTLVCDMGESGFQLFTKVVWIARYLTGKPPDRGAVA